MDWGFDALYGKARTYAARAYEEPVDSSLFGFWMSLALEFLCRSSLAKIHPVLLADPTNEGNIQYVFGINPKSNPKSVQAKTVFARCSVFIEGFTDKMSAHCLILADRRNSELHSGAAAFENIANSEWLPATLEVIEVLLRFIGASFEDFLGVEESRVANAILKDRQENIKRDVLDHISAAKKSFAALSSDEVSRRDTYAEARLAALVSENPLRRACKCPACGSTAIMTGESLSRGPVKIDKNESRIQREVRVLPNAFRCVHCGLKLDGYQAMLEAGLGTIYTTTEEEDPMEFFGIEPEEYVDVQKLIREYHDEGYMNE